MRAFLASALLAAPLMFAGQPAQAQYYNYNYRQFGSHGQGTIYGPNGYYGTVRQKQIGNFVNTTYQDNYGMVNCRTSYIGNFVRTNCY
jgi:hypothetical protein